MILLPFLSAAWHDFLAVSRFFAVAVDFPSSPFLRHFSCSLPAAATARSFDMNADYYRLSFRLAEHASSADILIAFQIFLFLIAFAFTADAIFSDIAEHISFSAAGDAPGPACLPRREADARVRCVHLIVPCRSSPARAYRCSQDYARRIADRGQYFLRLNISPDSAFTAATVAPPAAQLHFFIVSLRAFDVFPEFQPMSSSAASHRHVIDAFFDFRHWLFRRLFSGQLRRFFLPLFIFLEKLCQRLIFAEGAAILPVAGACRLAFSRLRHRLSTAFFAFFAAAAFHDTVFSRLPLSSRFDAARLYAFTPLRRRSGFEADGQ